LTADRAPLTIELWGSSCSARYGSTATAARCNGVIRWSCRRWRCVPVRSCRRISWRRRRWGETPPASWPKQIQGSVLRLRRTLGAAAIETTSAGYRLTVADDELDCRRFEELVARGRALSIDGEVDRAAVAFGRALELWRGAPLDVLDGWSPGRIEAARLEELRLSAEESLLDARLAAGEHSDVVAVAEVRVGEQPLREHRWAILGTALYRCGRQADALRALRTARHTLVEQLGIDPGAELVGLEQAILAQDESLVAVPAAPTISEHCPYKGLVPYDVADSEMFFGRDNEVVACLERLAASPLLVVTGPSGCGKSSLVRAGLIPALERAGHRVVVFVPGGDPQAAMTNALASSAEGGPVLVVDQFEELFTFDESGAERARSLCSARRLRHRDGASGGHGACRPRRLPRHRRRPRRPRRTWSAPGQAARRGVAPPRHRRPGASCRAAPRGGVGRSLGARL
jgi:DNA-binding SARP family transcriptional activator